MKKLIFSALLSIFINAFSYSQSKIYPHSLGVGVSGGVTELGVNGNWYNPVAGLNFHHQRNFADFFSIRTDIDVSRFFSTRKEYSDVNEGYWVKGEQTQSFVNTSVTSMPTFYLRAENMGFYVGQGFGLSYNAQYWSLYEERGYSNNEIITEERESKSRNVLIGFRPSLGVNFMLQGGMHEIDVMLSQNVWGAAEDFEFVQFWKNYGVWYSMTVSYQINFKKN